MNTAVINFNIDPKLKRDLAKTARDMGLTVSDVLTNAAKKIVAEKRMEFSIPVVQGTKDLARNKVIEAGGKDFALRFKDVMRELANG